MNNIRFILMVFCSSVILMVTVHLSAGISDATYNSPVRGLNNYSEIPSPTTTHLGD